MSKNKNLPNVKNTKVHTLGQPHVPKAPYPYQSTLAKTVWACEKDLPKPNLTVEVKQPAYYLADILQFARGAESRGEYLFRKNWLTPFIKKFVAMDEANSTWEDEMGNIVVHIGGAACFDTLHVGHIDTVHADDKPPLQHIDIRPMNKHGNSAHKDDREIFLKPVVKHSVPKQKTGVRWINDTRCDHHYVEYDLPTQTGARCLGADDGCAVAIMLWLMQHQVAGTYMFTRGEERGCKGTHFMMDKKDLDFTVFKRAIEVDRKGEIEIITKMSPGATASNLFGRSLATALGMGHKTSDKGSITDVGHLAKVIPECVNLAAGYYLQHSDRETTNPDYLNRLGAAMLTVDWNGLDSLRQAGEFQPKVIKSANQFHNNPRVNQQTMYNYGTSHITNKNKYGDYTQINLKSQVPLFDDCNNQYEIAAFIRANTGLIGEFLSALEVSLQEMDDICTFGLESDLAAYEPEDDDGMDEFEGQPEEVIDDSDAKAASEKKLSKEQIAKNLADEVALDIAIAREEELASEEELDAMAEALIAIEAEEGILLEDLTEDQLEGLTKLSTH